MFFLKYNISKEIPTSEYFEHATTIKQPPSETLYLNIPFDNNKKSHINL